MSSSEFTSFPVLGDCSNTGQKAPEPDRLDTVTLQMSKGKQAFSDNVPAHTCSGLDVLARYIYIHMCVYIYISDKYSSYFKEKNHYIFKNNEAFVVLPIFSTRHNRRYNFISACCTQHVIRLYYCCYCKAHDRQDLKMGGYLKYSLQVTIDGYLCRVPTFGKG